MEGQVQERGSSVLFHGSSSKERENIQSYLWQRSELLFTQVTIALTSIAITGQMKTKSLLASSDCCASTVRYLC